MPNITPEQLNQAADALQREAARTKGILDAAAALRDFGSFAAHSEELARRIKERQSELIKADRDLKQALEDTAKERKKAVEIGITAAAHCDRIQIAAEESVKKQHADAVTEAQRVMSDATEAARTAIDDGLAARMAIDEDVKEARAEHARIAIEVGKRNAELTELEGKLTAARGAAAAMLAGATK